MMRWVYEVFGSDDFIIGGTTVCNENEVGR
jgi:hypothetical protein